MVDISVKDVVKSFDLEKKILDGITFPVSYTHLTLPTTSRV